MQVLIITQRIYSCKILPLASSYPRFLAKMDSLWAQCYRFFLKYTSFFKYLTVFIKVTNGLLCSRNIRTDDWRWRIRIRFVKYQLTILYGQVKVSTQVVLTLQLF
jgi:hypothetical protein